LEGRGEPRRRGGSRHRRARLGWSGLDRSRLRCLWGSRLDRRRGSRLGAQSRLGPGSLLSCRGQRSQEDQKGELQRIS